MKLALDGVRERIDAAALAAAFALPARVQRLLAGRPIAIDGQTLAPDVQLMLRMQELARVPHVEKLPLHEGRHVLELQARLVGGTHPIGSVRELSVGDLPARLYTPRGVAGTSALLVFFHGGGFTYGSLDSHDATCRLLAERAGVRVLAVDYRLAPEHPFPAGHDDVITAYRWVVEHSDELGADPDRLAVGGDSAGGNLAAWVARAAAREGLPLRFQLLVYPCTDESRATRSVDLFGAGFHLTREYIAVMSRYLYGPDDDRLDERLSPLHADVPTGLAPGFLCTAGFDPLRDEGEAYARKLADAGVALELHRFPDQIHSFFNVVGLPGTPRTAVRLIAEKLRAGLR